MFSILRHITYYVSINVVHKIQLSYVNNISSESFYGNAMVYRVVFKSKLITKFFHFIHLNDIRNNTRRRPRGASFFLSFFHLLDFQRIPPIPPFLLRVPFVPEYWFRHAVLFSITDRVDTPFDSEAFQKHTDSRG